jgi:NAD(P)H-dependent FMN reductase
MTTATTRIGIVLGSTRPGRLGPQVAEWVRETAAVHTTGVEFEIVDIADYGLPLLDEPVPALMGAGTNPHTVRWSEKIRSLDGFLFVTPEYNRRAPSSLVNAMDYLYPEWTNKVVGYVGYGAHGALQAVDSLRAVAAAFKLADIGPEQVTLTLAADFVNFQELKARPEQEEMLRKLLDELLAWTGALAPLRVAGAARAAEAVEPVPVAA